MGTGDCTFSSLNFLSLLKKHIQNWRSIVRTILIEAVLCVAECLLLRWACMIRYADGDHRGVYYSKRVGVRSTERLVVGTTL